MRAALLTAVVLAWCAAPADASCVPAVIVDDRLLLGIGPPDPDGPAPGARLDAADPACNDTGGDAPDTPTTVRRLEGVPPRTGVLQHGELYVAIGTLLAVRGHPLRRAAPASHTPPARGPCRSGGPPLVGRAAADAEGFRLAVTAGRGERDFVVDGRTRVHGAPAEQPILRGQRLVVHPAICGGERFADRVTLLPPVLAGRSRPPDFSGRDRDGRFAGWIVLVVAAPVLLLVALAGALLRRA